MKTIDIYLKPYLRDFVISLYNGKINNSNNYILGNLLNPLITYMPGDYIYKPVDKSRAYISVDMYHFKGQYNEFDVRGNIYISEANSLIFEKLLSNLFMTYFISFIDCHITNQIYFKENVKRPSLKKAIDDFCLYFDLDLDIFNYEMLKKKYIRFKKKHKEFSEFLVFFENLKKKHNII